LKLFVLSIGVVDAFFEVSFYLGDGLCNVEILLRRWLSLVLLWKPIDGRWLLFVSFYLDNGFRVRVYCLSHLVHHTIFLAHHLQHPIFKVRI
jgi:hypothetical protein